jgi:hypothetical protein
MSSIQPGVTGRKLAGQKYVTRKQAVALLNAHGYKITLSTFNKKAMRGEAPEPDAAWAGRHMYRPPKILVWAKGLLGDPRALSRLRSAQARGESATADLSLTEPPRLFARKHG